MGKVLLVILIPFIGTSLGSALVFFMKNKLNKATHKLLLGFAAGVMIAASIWSLILPALEQGSITGPVSWLPAAIGVLLGFLFLLVIDLTINKISQKQNLINNHKKKSLLIFSITLHNIPEGMAVGVAVAGFFYGNSILTLSAAFGISLGIAIQNIPEGAIVSMPYRMSGNSKFKSFFYGVCSGLIEPLAAIVTFFITSFVGAILPYVLAFAAGSMLFVSVQEVIPDAVSEGYTNLATMGFAFGFVLMMVLDVALK